jgi:hypothetical protein
MFLLNMNIMPICLAVQITRFILLINTVITASLCLNNGQFPGKYCIRIKYIWILNKYFNFTVYTSMLP